MRNARPKTALRMPRAAPATLIVGDIDPDDANDVEEVRLQLGKCEIGQTVVIAQFVDIDGDVGRCAFGVQIEPSGHRTGHPAADREWCRRIMRSMVSARDRSVAMRGAESVSVLPMQAALLAAGWVTEGRNGFSRPEPEPEPNDEPAVWDLVVEDMRARDKAGEAHYGTRLQPFNGRDALVDAYQEALDLSVYLRQELAERERVRAVIDAMIASFEAGDSPPSDWTTGAIEALEALKRRLHS